MTRPVGSLIHLPPGLTLLLQARARETGLADEIVLHEAVASFAHLSPSVRAIHLNEYQWSGLPRADWETFAPCAGTLQIAGGFRLNWPREAFVLAAVSWFLAAD